MSGTNPFAIPTSELVILFREVQNKHDLISRQKNLEFPRLEGEIIGSMGEAKTSDTPHLIPDTGIFYSTPVVSGSLSILLDILQLEKMNALLFVPGGSLRYWLKVTEFCLDMVIRGRYLPSIGRYHNGGTCTVWNPIPSTYDKKRIEFIISSMPPNQVRFLQYGIVDSSHPGRSGAVLQFISQMINTIIAQSEHDGLNNPSVALSPIERLKYAPEIIAVSFLQGIERHKMPVQNPQIPNNWRGKFLTWTDSVTSSFPDDLPWIICARIEEISGYKNSRENSELSPEIWALVFYVRSSDDLTRLIPISEWKSDNSLPDLILPNSQELNIQVQNACEKILRHGQDLTLDHFSDETPYIRIAEDHLIQFLTHTVPLLREPGLEIVLPDWWGSAEEEVLVELSVRQSTSRQSVSHVGLHQLLSFDYRISVGDDHIDAAEFKRMVDQQTSYVRIGKRWVTLNTGKVSEIISGLEKKYKKHSLSLADFLRILIKTGDEDSNLRIHADDTWTKNLVRFIREGSSPQIIPVPSTFIGNLRPYQEAGLTFLSTCRSIGFGACLADDMGLGKTPQTIAYLLHEKEHGQLHKPSLLLCPTSILGNWERELSRFAPSLSYMVHHGSSRWKGEEFLAKAKDLDLIITSYAIIYRDQDLLSHLSYATLILDEVQNIKNAKTKQFQAVKTLEADHRIALTGTPVENHLIELWAIMEILNPNFLGSYSAFQKNFATPIGKGKADEKVAELKRIIQPFFLRRVKIDSSVINDLPDKLEIPVYCMMTPEQAAMYQATLDDLEKQIHSLSGMSRRGRILASLTRLKQICNHPDLVTKDPVCEPHRSGKVKRLIEMLEEVRDEGDAAIIFTQYATFAQALAKQVHLALEREVLVLTGSTSRLKREEMISRFMHQNGPQFFIISLRAGGTGLNLMRATHVFHIDRWWNPAVEDQATDRTYRIGQTRSVQVRQMITMGTLEEQIDEMIIRKRALADQIITSGEEWLTELPDGELMNILRLREQVFGDDL